MSGLSEFLGDSVRPVEVELRGADVSPLQLRDDPVAEALHQPLPLADLLGHLAQLAAQREAFGDRVGRDDDGRPALERVRERGAVAGAAGKLDSLPAERVTPPPRGIVSKRPRETGEQPDPELDAVLAEHGQTLLEQRHEPDVVRRSSPDDAPAIA